MNLKICQSRANIAGVAEFLPGSPARSAAAKAITCEYRASQQSDVRTGHHADQPFPEDEQPANK